MYLFRQITSVGGRLRSGWDLPAGFALFEGFDAALLGSEARTASCTPSEGALGFFLVIAKAVECRELVSAQILGCDTTTWEITALSPLLATVRKYLTELPRLSNSSAS
jgi:hypothetical protein